MTMTRKESAEKVFNYIRENKFEPIDIKYHSLSLLDDGEDYMVQFAIKGLHGWKFAMWLETNAEELKKESNRIDGKDYPAVQFFCQHKLNIVKFRPSRSFHLVNLSLEDIEEDKPWTFCYIRDMLQMIKRHPFVAFAMDAYEDCYCDESYIGCYLGMVLSNAKKKTKKWLNDARTS